MIDQCHHRRGSAQRAVHGLWRDVFPEVAEIDALAAKHDRVAVPTAVCLRSDCLVSLAESPKGTGISVWIDRNELKVGMSVYAAIDDALRSSRFGVVILSPAFFSKKWPQRELHSLDALAANETTRILPVWHNIDAAQLAQFSPLLADVWAARTTDGIESVSKQIVNAIKSPGSPV